VNFHADIRFLIVNRRILDYNGKIASEKNERTENKKVNEESEPKIKLSTIFWIMFRIGCITYGGGWSIFAQLEEEFGERRKWISKDDLLDIMSLARSFPGVMVINMSVMAGYKMRGVPGAMAAAFGLSTPAFFVISVVTLCYEMLMANGLVVRAMVGVRCSIIPIMVMAAVRMKKNALSCKAAYGFAAASFLLCVFSGINKLLMVIMAGLLGLFIWGRNDEKEGKAE